jgi:hypothetical protein
MIRPLFGFMATTLALIFSACTSVPIKNQTFYGDIGKDGAIAFQTLSTKTWDVSKACWDKIRFGMICEKAETFADWKSALEKLCSRKGACTYEEVQALKKLAKKLDQIGETGLLSVNNPLTDVDCPSELEGTSPRQGADVMIEAFPVPAAIWPSVELVR